MVDKLDEMEGKLNEQIEKNVALNKRLAESVSDVVFAEVTDGLAQTQKDKLAGLETMLSLKVKQHTVRSLIR